MSSIQMIRHAGIRLAAALFALCVATYPCASAAPEVPAQLPKPDQKAPEKPTTDVVVPDPPAPALGGLAGRLVEGLAEVGV